ncbi:hypothetical protein BKI52_03345 [marine bacterium AO1-C]|nr:hypothetical protein BKI52_03345 [marine bacterium AO1-C]
MYKLTTLQLRIPKLVFICYLLFLVLDDLKAQTPLGIQINQSTTMQLIGKKMWVLEDPAGKLNFTQILASPQQQKFQPFNKNVFNVPPNKVVYWFKFSVQNQTSQSLWLEIGHPLRTWYADLYAPVAPGQYDKPRLLGSFRPRKNKEFPASYYYALLAEKNDTTVKTFYLRLAGSFAKTNVFRVGTHQAITQQSNARHFTAIGFISLMLTLAIYNFFLLISTRSKIYLLYILHLLTSVIGVCYLSGFPMFQGSWFLRYFFVWFGFSYVFITLFSIHYLQLRKHLPYVTIWLWIINGLLGIGFPILNLFHLVDITYLGLPYQLITSLLAFSLLFCGIYLWIKKQSNARFYVIPWSLAIVSTFIYMLTNRGLVPINFFTEHVIYCGYALEALMFALALGNRLNTLQKEKEKAQQETLQLFNNQNMLLEQTVVERTKELQDANEMLKMSNEELTLNQEEIASQRDVLETQNQKLSSYSNRIGKSFLAAKLIQNAILPEQTIFEENFSDHFIIYRPKDVVSGDFYWVNKVGNQLILVIADCTGHGVPGAFMTLIGKNLLDKIIQIDQVTSPEKILHHLHEEVMVALRQEATQHNEAGMDATIVSIAESGDDVFDIHFAGAKNSLLYITPPQLVLEEIKGTRKSIGGVHQNKTDFQKHSLSLPKGSLMYFGSDGLADQNNVELKKFGKQRLKDLLQENYSFSLEKQKQAIDQALKEHMFNTDQRDDIMWIGVKL